LPVIDAARTPLSGLEEAGGLLHLLPQVSAASSG